MVLFPGEFRISRSLRKTLRQGGYRVCLDSGFKAVIQACARKRRPGQAGTWITPEIQAAYLRLHELGYKVVFSGDNHKAFDVRVGGVDFHNVGALTRRDVTLANQRPRYIVLYSDLTTESFYVGNDDVFDLGRSDADKTRDGDKDEFSAALAGGFSYDETFKGNLELAAKTGRIGDAELTEPQRRLLRDIINAI